MHAGLPTDRLVAEWYLDSARVNVVMNGEVPRPGTSAARITIPQDISARKQVDANAGARVQAEMREEFLRYFNQGFVVTGLEIGQKEANYVLEEESRMASQIATN